MALRTRKHHVKLTPDERKRFIAAVKKMMDDATYDWYVQTHIDSMWMLKTGDMTMWAHMRPAFLPWHRQFILDFENEMRKADTALTGKPSDLSLPYWDWISDRSTKPFLYWGHMWDTDFMGPDGSGPNNKVSDGKFKDWHPVYNAGDDYEPFTGPPGTQPDRLRRLLGRDPNGNDSLPTQEQWDAARAITTYDVSPYDSNIGRNPAPVPNPVRFAGVKSFRNVFEGWVPYYDSATAAAAYPNLHNRVHNWVGGSMIPFSSPNDPVFFLHHCNVDRLWAQWWSDDPKRPYVPAGGVANPTDSVGENMMGPTGPVQTGPEVIDLKGHHLHDPMPPWDGRTDPDHGTMPKVSPANVLNHIKLGYRYDTDPPSLTAKSKP